MRKGIIRWGSLVTVLSLSLIGLSQEAHAVPAYDALAAMSGSRTIESGLTGTGPFDHHEGSGIRWDITEDGGQYHYNYTLFGFAFGGGSALDHLTLDISDLCSATAGCLSNVRLNGQPIGSFLQFSTLIDGVTGAVKFDIGSDGTSATYSFDSTRQPVWGDVFIQGEEGAVVNTGLGNHGAGTIQDFIARPDTQTSAVPEPASLLLLATGLSGLVAWRVRTVAQN
jgi:hypothetical protein